MNLELWLASIDRYRELLTVLESFHRACEPALSQLIGDGPPELRDGIATRCARLQKDRAALGGPAAVSPGVSPVLATVDHRLGAWYVLEGASLGGLVIAAEIRRRLPAAAPATTYFAGEGPGTAARWRRFHGVLAGWEDRGAAAADRVVTGALNTFGTLEDQLRSAA